MVRADAGMQDLQNVPHGTFVKHASCDEIFERFPNPCLTNSQIV